MVKNPFIETGELLKGLGIGPIDLSSLGATISSGGSRLVLQQQNVLKPPSSTSASHLRVALSPKPRPSKSYLEVEQIQQRSHSTNRIPQANILPTNRVPAYIPMVQQKPDPSFVSPAVTGKYSAGITNQKSPIFGETKILPDYQQQHMQQKNLKTNDAIWKGTPFDSPKQQSSPKTSFGQVQPNNLGQFGVTTQQQIFKPSNQPFQVQTQLPNTQQVGPAINTEYLGKLQNPSNNYLAAKAYPSIPSSSYDLNPEVQKIIDEIKLKNQTQNITSNKHIPANFPSFTNNIVTPPQVGNNLNKIPNFTPKTPGLVVRDFSSPKVNLITTPTTIPASSNTTPQSLPYSYIPPTQNNYKISPQVTNMVPSKQNPSKVDPYQQKKAPLILPQESIMLLKSTMMKSISPFAPSESQTKKGRLSEKYQRIVEECKRSKQMFTDYEFPAASKSIAKPEDLNEYRGIKRWVRPKDIWPNRDFELYYQIIEANDVQQGNLADCAFLSALAALAETPSRIQRIFVNQRKSEYGVYSVNFIWRGTPIEVVVDDFIPVDSRDKPFFQQSKEKELWAFVLEKAWAKLHGNYHQLSGMLTKEALHDLTGAPLRNFDPQHCDEQAVWKRLLLAKEKGNNWIIAAGTRGEDTGDDSDPLKRDGLISGHAYTVLAVYEIEVATPYGKKIKERLVKLRNPWGSFEWNKTFSDNDKNWDLVTQSTQLRVDFKQEDDGTFFMRWDAFREYFDSLDICYYYDDFEYFGVRSRKRYDEGQFFRVEIKRESECFFFVSQISIRLFDETYQFESPAERGHYSEALFVISDAQGNLLQRIKGKKRDLFSPKYLDSENRLKFKQGIYYAYVHVNWQKNATHSFGFGVYAKQAEITPIMPFEAAPISQQAKKWQAGPTYDIDFESVYGRV